MSRAIVRGFFRLTGFVIGHAGRVLHVWPMAQTLTIRRTRAADLAELDVLFRRSYPALLKGYYPPSVMVSVVPQIARANPDLVVSGTYFAVVDEAGQIVGAGGWTRSGGRRARARAEVRHFVTDARRVREGIARTLMRRVFFDVRACGLSELRCLSTVMAVPFYASCGFAIVRPVTLPLVAGIDFEVMEMRRLL